MAFDLKGFSKAQFQQRTAEVKIDNECLGSFFDGDPLWIVRGLTAGELAQAEESVSANMRSIIDVIKDISALNDSDKITELANILGDTKNLPVEVKKKIEHLVIASVDPKIDHREAVILQENFPIEFLTLVNKIHTLTGMGADIKKSQSSGETGASKTP